MSKKYIFRKLEREEWRTLEQVLLEQMEAQRWYGIAFIQAWQEEVLLALN